VTLRKPKIYFDGHSFDLPYDDQAQPRKGLENKAKLYIEQQVKENKLILIPSETSEFKENADVISIAKEISSKGIADDDAIHVAYAIYTDCDFFISADSMLLKFRDNRIRLINPVDFIMMKAPFDFAAAI